MYYACGKNGTRFLLVLRCFCKTVPEKAVRSVKVKARRWEFEARTERLIAEVDAVGWSSGVVYAIVVPVFLGVLFAKQSVCTQQFGQTESSENNNYS